MRVLFLILASLVLCLGGCSGGGGSGRADGDGYAGSASCRECHERFYTLWSTSHHGLAMQPVTEDFVQTELLPMTNDISVGEFLYKADIQNKRVVEEGANGLRTYSLEQAMGGKNIYYFLTTLERGKLQVLPLAFDVRKRTWYSATASMVRHVIPGDAPIEWKDPLLTFNAACYGCHVSQLSKNYDVVNDSYKTVWREPGINCETCHGPSAEHIKVCRESPTNVVPADLKIISMKTMTMKQRDETCAPCHAKMVPLTGSFTPGDRFFDNYDLVGFEDRDFYPDGRDLGENYTYTSWLTAPCVKAGKLECLHCHTSSGRYRFASENKNGACLPCHEERVKNVGEHSRHSEFEQGNECISCHMPTTMFAGMRRSDHSMMPPTPSATIKFASPNACNMCHEDKTAEWADAAVREWHKDDYQVSVLRRGEWFQAARKGDWSKLDEMLSYISDEKSDSMVVSSMIRLLAGCSDTRKWPVLRKAVQHIFPLVRSAAVRELAGDYGGETMNILLAAAADEYRVVRLAAASSLSRYPDHVIPAEKRALRDEVFEELKKSLVCVPDHWASYYNLGNFQSERGEEDKALESYEHSMRLRGDVVAPMVNAAMLHARRGDSDTALRLLKKAYEAEPESAAVNYNLGLGLAEKGLMADAQKHLRLTMKADPSFAAAAYNLGVMLNSGQVTEEGLSWCRRAVEIQPEEPRYVTSLAFYLNAGGKIDEAVRVLDDAMARGVVNQEIKAMRAQLQGR